jgi:hypothetical protein
MKKTRVQKPYKIYNFIRFSILTLADVEE